MFTSLPLESLWASSVICSANSRVGVSISACILLSFILIFSKIGSRKASVLPLVVFLRDCGDLSGFTADSGEERRRKNVAGANGGDWHYR